MSDLKMGVLDECNDSPISSPDSFSGYYRNLRMSYDAMVEVRRLERKYKLALKIIEKLKKSNDFYADKNNWDENIIDNFEDLDGNKSPAMDDYCVTGGKLARQTQKEVNEMMEKLNDKRS